MLNMGDLTVAQKQERKDKERQYFLFVNIDLMKDISPKDSWAVVSKASTLNHVGSGCLFFDNFSGASNDAQRFALTLANNHHSMGIKNKGVTVSLGGNFHSKDKADYMSSGDLSKMVVSSWVNQDVVDRTRVTADINKEPTQYVPVAVDGTTILRFRAFHAKAPSVNKPTAP